ncbi:hypothetical protein KAR91_38730 [Candidatus Pacearchaeota archaeon]|nr:hypothetical protein [Candidatus Pacearchaeota archaeon]
MKFPGIKVYQLKDIKRKSIIEFDKVVYISDNNWAWQASWARVTLGAEKGYRVEMISLGAGVPTVELDTIKEVKQRVSSYLC